MDFKKPRCTESRADRLRRGLQRPSVGEGARLQTHCDPDGILVAYETYVLVRDIVDFEERKPVDLKGIRRKVKTFAVRALNEPGPDASRRFHYDQDGLKLSLDLTKMVGSARAEALHSLEGIVSRLRDLPEPASGSEPEPAVAGSAMADAN